MTLKLMGGTIHDPLFENMSKKLKSRKPDIAWKWRKWTFGFWTDPENWTAFGIDVGPLEIVWRYEGYRQ